MRDMVAQCDSNMSELQQLQVRPPPRGPRPPPKIGAGSPQTSPGRNGLFRPAMRGCAMARAPRPPVPHP